MRKAEEVHHIIPIWFAHKHPHILTPELITSLENALPLCPQCHKIENTEQRKKKIILMTIAVALFGLVE